MNILVSGACGQLGQELMLLGRQNGNCLIALDLPEMDITRPQSVSAAINEHKPDLIVNAAAYTDVDGAETEIQQAFRVNCDGPANLAAACADNQIPLIHISTDYVFDGGKKAPYVESDPISPVGIYARSKADGEARVRSLAPCHVILRTSWLYSAFGKNFVKTMLALGEKRRNVTVVADQFGTPTSSQDLAQTILTIASSIRSNGPSPWGTYHYANTGVTSWYEFALEIFKIASSFGLFESPRVTPISTDQYPTPARRPPYSALDCTLIQRKLNIVCPPWQESLQTVIHRIVSHAA